MQLPGFTRPWSQSAPGAPSSQQQLRPPAARTHQLPPPGYGQRQQQQRSAHAELDDSAANTTFLLLQPQPSSNKPSRTSTFLLPEDEFDDDPLAIYVDDDGSSISTANQSSNRPHRFTPYRDDPIADDANLDDDSDGSDPDVDPKLALLPLLLRHQNYRHPRPRPRSRPRSHLLAKALVTSGPSRAARRALRFYVPERRRTRLTAMFLLAALLVLGGVFGYLWRAEAALSAPWVPDPASRLFAQRPLPDPDPETLPRTFALPLSTRGRDVVDAKGRRFKLASVNWYGASDELFAPGGLDVQHRSVIAQTIVRLGFNSVRVPYSDELVMANPVVDAGVVAANPDLVGLRAMDVLEAAVTALTDAGLAVIMNNHITSAQWCCGADPCDAGWANDHLGGLCRVRQSEDDWIAHWEEIMTRFAANPLVVGADLRNEVRGLWGTMPWARWAAAAERAGNRLLAINPHWLIVVGGTESGNDLSGARRRPVVLDVPGKLVYSAHVYAWSGWGSPEGRYAKRSYASFAAAMRRAWAYLLEEDEDDAVPVWVGEFGAPAEPSVGDANYWANLVRFLKVTDADFGYWAVNPRKPHGNEVESYGLVGDDWVTPIVDYRMKDMVEMMRWRRAGRGQP